jgi:hypothetical protein
MQLRVHNVTGKNDSTSAKWRYNGGSEMEEKVFFEHGDVKVTNARFITGGQTYAMSNVTSVKAFEEKPKRFGGIVVLIVGLLFALNVPVVGLLLAGAAAFYLYSLKTFYHVMLFTAGGEASALKTEQREYLNSVVSALNEAIIHRG